MSDTKTITKSMNGRLSDKYDIITNIFQKDNVDGIKTLVIDSVLSFNGNKSERIALTTKKNVVKLYINNELEYKECIDIDTSVLDNVRLLNFRKDYKLNSSTLVNFKIVVDILYDSDYLETTELSDSFIISADKDKKLFIDLDYTESENLVFCTYRTTLDPDFIEYKTNFTDWSRLNPKVHTFTVKKEDKNMWIQVRGKYKDKYTYSNSVKILSAKI